MSFPRVAIQKLFPQGSRAAGGLPCATGGFLELLLVSATTAAVAITTTAASRHGLSWTWVEEVLTAASFFAALTAFILALAADLLASCQAKRKLNSDKRGTTVVDDRKAAEAAPIKTARSEARLSQLLSTLRGPPGRSRKTPVQAALRRRKTYYCPSNLKPGARPVASGECSVLSLLDSNPASPAAVPSMPAALDAGSPPTSQPATNLPADKGKDGSCPSTHPRKRAPPRRKKTETCVWKASPAPDHYSIEQSMGISQSPSPQSEPRRVQDSPVDSETSLIPKPEPATRVPLSREVMVVEDDHVQSRIVCRITKGAGFAAVPVFSGDGAVSLLTKRAASGAAFPDLILLDNSFGEGSMSGVDTARCIRSRFPDTPVCIIMVTADESEDTLCAGLQAGCNDYYCKPVRKNRLLSRLYVQLELLEFWRFQVSSRKSESLLKTILPPSVIKRYLQSEERVVDELPCISVLFMGIVDFPRIQDMLGCRGTMAMLNELFCAFDDLTDRLDVYKVETVGDTYMVMSGHDDSSRQDHAHRLAALSQLMLKTVERHPALKLPTGEIMQLRIGIHTGTAHSGIIGLKCPRYCLFGDTINTASRMMSTCFPQCVQVSEAAHRQLQGEHPAAVFSVIGRPSLDASDIKALRGEESFYSLGTRSIKGKGSMNTWLLPYGRAEEATQTYMLEIAKSTEW